MFEFVILAVGDVFWGSLFSGVALVMAALIARGNTKTINSIDRAVNDQDKGMPTLVGRVISQDERGIETAAELAEFRKWTQDAFKAFGDAQNVVIPPIPDPVPIKPVATPRPSVTQ